MIVVEAAGLSVTGRVREENEDGFVQLTPSDPLVSERKGSLLAVADGLGGHAAGQVASATALKGLVEAYYAPTSPSRVEPALQRAFQVANLKVHDASRGDELLRSMQTTLSCVALVNTGAFLGHVGDSRVYLHRDGQLSQLTGDHSEAAELIRLRLAKPESLSYHPRRNVLTRTVGSQLFLRPDFQRVQLLAGDVLVLCTDGLWSEVSDDEIAATVASHDVERACERLVDLQLERESADNATVLVARVAEVTPEAEPASEGWVNRVIGRLVGRGSGSERGEG